MRQSITRGPWRSACVPGLVCVAAMGWGCSSAEMRYHFAAADLDEIPPRLTFYRITIRGSSGLETAKLQTGYYDAEALHALFGEVKDLGKNDDVRPADPKDRVGELIVELDPATKRWHVVRENERFTVFFGSNADAMAQQVGAFADSSQTGDDIASLLAAAAGRERFDSLRIAKQDLSDKEVDRAALETALKAIQKEVEVLPTEGAKALTVDDIRQRMRNAAQATLTRAGSQAQLPTALDEAFTQAEKSRDELRSAK